MNTILLNVAFSLLILGAATAVLSTRLYLRRMTRSSVVVHTTDGVSIKGVLMAVHTDVIVIAHASAAPEGASGFTPVDGEQVVARDHVSWIQRLGSGDAG